MKLSKLFLATLFLLSGCNTIHETQEEHDRRRAEELGIRYIDYINTSPFGIWPSTIR